MERLGVDIVAFLSLVLAVSACEPSHYRNFQHPNYGQAEFDRDNYQCRRENTYASADGPEVDLAMARTCMQIRGWREVSQ
jgi:hypothetical protein